MEQRVIYSALGEGAELGDARVYVDVRDALVWPPVLFGYGRPVG